MNNLSGYLYDFARLAPDKPALSYPEKVTFAELCRVTDIYAAGFIRSAIGKGTKTIVLVSPGKDLFAVVFALLRIGAIPVLIDPGMGYKAMAKALSEIEAGAFVGIPKAHLLRILYPEAFKTVEVFVSTSFRLSWKDFSLKNYHKSGCIDYDICDTGASDRVAVFFTSGSTGPAKAVVYRKYMLGAQLEYLKDPFNFSPDDIDLCTFPLIGLLVMNLGISVVLADMDMARPARLSPRKIIENILHFRCSSMFCSPMVLKKITDYATGHDIKLLSLKKVFVAGAPVSPDLLGRFRKLLPADTQVHTPFGSTEALSITDAVDSDLLDLYDDSDNRRKGICIGTPLKNIRIRLIRITDEIIGTEENAEEVKQGEIGEMIVCGPNVTREYDHNDKANRIHKIEDNHTPCLWHRTGDLARIDVSGRFWYCGRKSQRVETGDSVFYTILCESVFNEHPGVSRSALVGIRLKNQLVPVICIELKKGIRKSEKLTGELLDLARKNELTRSITIILFHRKFPVDPRHNAKIFREKLAVWAQKKIT